MPTLRTLRASTVIALGIVVSSALFACQKSSQEARWSAEGAEYATYATEIPLYPTAKLESAMGSDLYGDTKADHMKGMAWWFEVEGTFEEMEAWYDERLAGAEKESTDDGYVMYTVYPDDGDDGEYMGVIVEEDGKFRVFERVKPANANS